MTLQECHSERSYYYPKLELEIRRIIKKEGLGHIGGEVIAAFCNGLFGDLQIDSTKDYKNILHVFQCFLAGAAWALKHPGVDGQTYSEKEF